MKTREIGCVVVAAGKDIIELLLVQWWPRNLIRMAVTGNKGTDVLGFPRER